MHSVAEKFQWIKTHIWYCSPVWFNCGINCCAIYSTKEVELTPEGRILWKCSPKPIDITYFQLTAFASKGSEELVQYGYEPIEMLYREGKKCTVKE